MKMPKFNSRYMAIHADEDLEMALQIPLPESPFQVVDY